MALASAAVSALAAIRSRKSRAEADRRAKDAAEAAVRSADAAVQSVEAQRQAADAAQEFAAAYQNEARIRAAEREAAADEPPWDLMRQGEFNVLLMNNSPEPRFHVTADGEQVRAPGGFAWELIEADESEMFHVLAGDDASPQIVVTWYDTEIRAGEPRRWRGFPRS
ncbi:hypothetical protein AWC29_28415 [Mycobacterium triplex]|uniref:Secreted protein n=1 Tax=Mycobacterium triplex TaxID=47839 RepID=A0ABX3VXA1_9MYCO|nr:hypothetical protein AWC29_28415 [Mycobacterium triplex]